MTNTITINIADIKKLAFKIKATSKKTTMTNDLINAIDEYLDENKK